MFNWLRKNAAPMLCGERVQVLVLRDGDQIILSTEGSISAAAKRRLKDNWRDATERNGVAVLECGLRLTVLRREKAGAPEKPVPPPIQVVEKGAFARQRRAGSR